MTILRPITEITPSSVSTLEATGLPLGFTLQPFGSENHNDNGDDEDDDDHANNNKKVKRKSSSRSSSRSSRSKNNRIKSHCIAKCTNCGSVMNPTTEFTSSWDALCHLCGENYNVHFDTQCNLQYNIMNNRGSNNDTNIVSNRHRGQQQKQKQQKNHERRKKEYESRYNQSKRLPECTHNLMEYDAPLFSIPVSLSKTTLQEEEEKAVEEKEVFSLPTTMCPPLITFLIDGTCTNPNYYQQICTSIHALLDSTNSHPVIDNSHGNISSNSNSSSSSSSKGSSKGSRMGIFIMTKGGGLSIFDLKSPCGHLKHTWVKSPPLSPSTKQRQRQEHQEHHHDNKKNAIPLADIMDIEHVYVPLDDNNKSCIESALRVLADYTILNQVCQRNHNDDDVIKNKNNNNNDSSGGTYFGSTIQYILEYLQDVAYHPGMYQLTPSQATEQLLDTNDSHNDENRTKNIMNQFLYCGGKILCFLAGPPKEIGFISDNFANCGQIGGGGFGGSCAEIGKRFHFDIDQCDKNEEEHTKDKDDNADDDHDDIDIERGQHNIHMPKSYTSRKNERGSNDGGSTRKIPCTAMAHVDDYYQSLGIQCAQFATSVEIFGFIDEDKYSSCTMPYLGMPYTRLLSDRSGGNGPLIFPMTSSLANTLVEEDDCDTGFEFESCNDVLTKEVLSRSTLTRKTAYGGLLRIRLSPSFAIKQYDHADLIIEGEVIPSDNDNLLDFYCTNGIYGPVSPSQDFELFVMGTCDATTTLSFELDIVSDSGTIGDYVYVNDRDKQLTPCIQTCFAYTSVDMIDGCWTTQRRLRVLTHRMNLSDDTEYVTLSLDNEALAVNLFHTFYSVSSLYKSEVVKYYATNWIFNVLQCCYESAQATYRRREKGQYNTQHFHPDIRLLHVNDDSGSKYSNEEILLAQGHATLHLTTLLTFCLIQCDALRPSVEGNFHPTIDSQTAAAANLHSMSPSILSRNIAPRLEMWQGSTHSDINEPLRENLTMSLYSIIEEGSKIHDTGIRPILFLDSPQQIILLDSTNLCGVNGEVYRDEQIPLVLKKTVHEAAKSYRVVPPLCYCVTKKQMEHGSDYALNMLKNGLIEDSILSRSSNKYKDWCTFIAGEIERLLVK